MTGQRVRAAWEAELDRLELHVIRTERLARGEVDFPAESWTPPSMAGPMPADLVPRAAALLARQDAVAGVLTQALAGAQKQIAYADRLSDATGPGAAAPVYLDLEA